MATLDDFSTEQLKEILTNIHKLPIQDQAETLSLLEEVIDRRAAVSAKDSVLAFAHRVAPVLQIETEPKVFMVGPHHKRLAVLMDAIARGEKKRVLISVAPRMGKSLLSSYIFPAWYMGKFPNRRMIMASHTVDLAAGFGRKVRDLIDTPEYRAVFPEVELKADSKAAGQWATNKGGEFFSVGTGGALAGRGADCVIIDDPFSEKDIISGNTQVFEDAWTWFQSGPLQRLSPTGAILVIHCMVGDTRVLLPDGTEKNLRDVEVGDEIATYDKGKVTKAKVLNWVNQGCDRVLAIRMKSGVIVRANKRHPFLVQRGDTTEWTKVENLKVGEHILRVNTGVTKECHALLKAAANQPDPEVCASEIILDEIVSITEDGVEEVFDIQVEGTENFIANGLVSHNTRWAKTDLIGRLIDQMAKNPDSEQWEVVEFPAILNEDTPEEKSLWPERWPLEVLKQKKAVMAPFLWNAQYMQAPTGEAGALIKRDWWKTWDKEDPPDCEYVIMSLDAAQEAHNRADYNAFQVWGVFYDDTGRGAPIANIILLDAWKKRMEYPEMKAAMIDEYAKWEPDTFVIEKKSSGSVLYQELRHAGIPVSDFTPGKGNDKIARVNSVSDIFSSGLVWAPTERRWAMEVIEECSDFPNGEHDDQVDAMTLAIRRFRTGGFIKLPTDEKDDEDGYRGKRKYY